MTHRIEQMTTADAQRCADLEVELFAADGPWTASAFRSELAASHNHYVVGRDDTGRAVGYAGVALLGSAANTEAEIHTIGVDPSAMRQGWGRALLGELLRVADAHGGPVFLEVRTDNEPAISLYRGVGFEVVGTRKRYYQPSGADAYTMRRPAPGEDVQQ